MRNIYIETDENFRVIKIHRAPFDPNNGMGYTREELEKKGFFVEEIPDAANKVGKRAIAMYNPDIKAVYYEYVNVPLSDRERADMLENAMNWMMRNAIYGAHPVMMTMDAKVEAVEPKLNVYEEGAAKYMAHQIMSGKMNLNETLSMFPQFESYIKSVLKDNGIQV